MTSKTRSRRSRREVPPRFQRVPSARLTDGPRVVELMARTGIVLDPEQELVLEGALRRRADGRWAATDVALIEPRQNGKGDVLVARQLGGLFLFGERLQKHTAHRADTSAEHFLRVWERIKADPWMRKQVRNASTANGKEGIYLKNGQRLLFSTRSKAMGRGPSPEVVYIDEALYLLDLAAVVPSLSAKSIPSAESLAAGGGGPQFWFTSSAPPTEAGVEAEELRNLMRRGRSGKSRRLAYFEWSADPACDLGDPVAWRSANPALGVRISEEYVEGERESIGDEKFKVERLGIVTLDAERAASWQVVTEADYHATETEVELVDPVTLAIAVAPDRSSAAIGSAGETTGPDGVVVVDHRPLVGWLVDRVVEVYERHGARGVVVDTFGPAGTEIDELVARGVKVVPANTQAVKQACGQIFDDFVEGDLVHGVQPILESAVAGASKRKVGEAWAWARTGDTDITPLEAVTLALWGHRQPVEVAPTARFVSLSEV